jgi:hypothetical protein
MNRNQIIGLGVLGGVAGLVGVGVAGLQVRPPAVKLPAGPDWQASAEELPESLPAPVFRHFQQVVGRRHPYIRTAVLGAQARFRMGLWLPMRFVAYHVIGQHFIRDMEVTWFGYTVFSGEDRYVNGQGLMNIGGQVSHGPEIDQGEAMAMWAEAALLFPSATINRPGVRWEAVNNTTAHLYFPVGSDEEMATVTFDPQTGFAQRFSCLRYKEVGQEKEPWHVLFKGWHKHEAMMLPSQIEVLWEREGSPWFKAEITGVSLNVDLSAKFPAE